MKQIEKYGVFEYKIESVKETAAVLPCGVFRKDRQEIPVCAFRNRDEEYIVRFMPAEIGTWEYCLSLGNRMAQGEFACVENAGKNHGRVVVDGFHFRYEDGESYIPFGTTCYAWIHQTEELQRRTLQTLAESSFNKIRMCVFPKSMPYNNNDPDCYPFRKKEDGSWDVGNPDPDFWEKLDHRIEALMELGVEADLILFHPYDRWGFAALTQRESMQYLEYAVVRLCAFRNIWWSLANEYELLYSKSLRDWDEYGEFLRERDLYGHLRSVHNILDLFPKREWLSHCSVQSGDINRIPLWRQEYDLPVIIDECGYEGDLPYGWGSLTAQEMVHRFWWSVCRGGFCTHGETFHREDEILWWAKGGTLYGESEKRIAFLKDTLYRLSGKWRAAEYAGINPNLDGQDAAAGQQEDPSQKIVSKARKETRESFMATVTPMRLEGDGWVLEYFGHMRPKYLDLQMENNCEYRIEILDTWEMTRQVAAKSVAGPIRVSLPAKEGIALLVTELKLI